MSDEICTQDSQKYLRDNVEDIELAMTVIVGFIVVVVGT